MEELRDEINIRSLLIINGGRAEPETEAIGRITVLAARATL